MQNFFIVGDFDSQIKFCNEILLITFFFLLNEVEPAKQDLRGLKNCRITDSICAVNR